MNKPPTYPPPRDDCSSAERELKAMQDRINAMLTQLDLIAEGRS